MPSSFTTTLVLAWSLVALSPVTETHDAGDSRGGVGSSNIWYVDADAPGSNDGSSWENAFLSPHGALAVATEGDEIRVAQGLYHPAPPDGDRQISFWVVSRVALRGGFAGYGETDPDERDVSRFTTVLSGDLNGNDPIMGPFDPYAEELEENSLHVLFGGRLGETTLVEGFTITGGNANRGSYDGIERNGGGLNLEFAVLTVRECAFARNFASLDGGGISIEGSGSLLLEDCRFTENMMEHAGGAIYTYGAHLALRRCVFLKNGPVMPDEGNGGAIGTDDSRSNLTLENCFFAENFSFSGGAVNFHGFLLRATDCVFENNGAYWDGAGLRAEADDGMHLTNCRFTNNHSRVAAGAVVVAGGADGARITNCTFFGNEAQYLTGAGLIVNGHPIVITNSIFHGNALNGEVGESAQIGIDGSAELEINFSTVEGWTGRFEGRGSTGLDPQFVDAEGGDFRLSPGSPVIDAGDSAAVPFDIETDLDGNPRIIDDPAVEDTGIPGCPIVDMGAYEFQAEGGCCSLRRQWICDADVDVDGQVNPVDSGLVQASFGSTDDQDLCNYDLDCDGQINPVDAGIVQSLFGTCEAPRDSCP